MAQLPTTRTHDKVNRTLALAEGDLASGEAYGRQYLHQALVIDMLPEHAALGTILDAASEICDDFEAKLSALGYDIGED